MPADPSRDATFEDGGPDLDRRGLPLVRLGLRIAAAAAVIAGLSVYARHPGRAPAPVAASAPVVPPPQVSGPAPAPVTPARLGLAEPGIDPIRVAAGRVDPAAGSREDVLTRGAFEAIEAPALRLTLTRGAEAGRAPGLFVLLARRAAGGPGSEGPALAVMRTGAYGRIATKFGAVETLEATLGGSLRRSCTGFVTRESGLRIDGWLCAPLGRAPEPRALACTLDALSLDDPADPSATAQFRVTGGGGASGCERPAAMADPAGRTGSIQRRRAHADK